MKIHLLSSLGLLGAMASAHADPSAYSQEVWDQVAYPNFCDLNAGLGVSLGLSLYSIESSPNTDQHLVDVSLGAYTLGASQVIGYSHWFYVEMRENLSYGNTFYGVQDDNKLLPRRLSGAFFFDADTRLFMPFRVSPANRLSLQPFIGFAIHQAYLKGRLTSASVKGALLRQRYLAPLAGLALGFNPTPAFAFRSSLSVHIPYGKQAQPMQSEPAAHEYRALRMQRHGIGADLLFLARLSANWTLTGELDYFSYSAFGHSTTPWRTNYTSCLSAKVGGLYQF